MEPLVSIIIPFYGTAQSQRLELAIESILSQKGVNIDLIISGLNEVTRVNEPSDFLKHPKEEVPKLVRMGAIINNGLKLARGEFTYVTDADILLLNQYYLESLIKEFFASGSSLKRPPMRRLLIQDFDWFYSEALGKGLEEAVKLLDISQDYVVKPRQSERPMRIFKKFERGRYKTFIASEKDFHKYISDERKKRNEPLYFNQDGDCDAIFGTTKNFYEVGGYYEDLSVGEGGNGDIKWKLENKIGIQLIPKLRKFEVIPLDTEREYFPTSKLEYDKNYKKKGEISHLKDAYKEIELCFLGGKNER